LIVEGEQFGQRLPQAGVDAAISKAEGQVHDNVMLEPIQKSAMSREVVQLRSLKLKNALGLCNIY